MSPSASPAPHAAVALPPDLLHGLALRPPFAAWDGLRYQGAELAAELGEAWLAEARGMAGVVAAVRRANFLGVVAVAPVHARQAAASLVPVWYGASAAAPLADSDGEGADPFIWRMPRADAPAGAQAIAWCADGHASLWLPRCAAELQAMIIGEIAALLQLPVSALRVRALEGAAPHPLDLMDAAADAALLSQAVGRPVSVACEGGQLPGELVLRPARVSGAGTLAARAEPGTALQPGAAAPAPAIFSADQPWAVRPSLARLLSQPGLARAAARASVVDAGTVQARR